MCPHLLTQLELVQRLIQTTPVKEIEGLLFITSFMLEAFMHMGIVGMKEKNGNKDIFTLLLSFEFLYENKVETICGAASGMQ